MSSTVEHLGYIPCNHQWIDRLNGFQKCDNCGSVRFHPSLRQQELQESVLLNDAKKYFSEQND